MDKYKTLYYLNACGLDLEDEFNQGRYNIIKGSIKRLTDYELKYYHCKVLKMPLRAYDKAGLIMAVFHNALTEYESMQADRVEELKEEHQKNRAQAEKLQAFNRAFKIMLICSGLVFLFCLGACCALWFLI